MRFDEDFLIENGFDALPSAQQGVLLDYLNEQLEVEVGKKIAEGVPDEELARFEVLPDSEAIEWLEKNKPNYQEIIEEVFEGIKDKVIINREVILSN